MKNLSGTIAALLLCLHCFALSISKETLTVPIFIEAEYFSPLTIRVPFRLAGRLIVVQAEVEGERGNFIIDTGSEKLVLNARHFGVGWRDKNSTFVGTLGNMDKVRSHRVRNLAWQGMSFKKVKADVIDLSHIEEKKNIPILGLIGYEVFKDCELLIDFQLRQIVLMRTNEAGERLDRLAIVQPPVDSLPFLLKQHMAVLNANINGHDVIFGLDSGAEYNLLNRKLDRKVLENFKITQRDVVLNDIGGRAAMEVLAGKIYRFSVQNRPCPSMRTLLMNMDHLNRVLRTRLDGVLGVEFLARWRTIINYKKKKLYFLEWE